MATTDLDALTQQLLSQTFSQTSRKVCEKANDDLLEEMDDQRFQEDDEARLIVA